MHSPIWRPISIDRARRDLSIGIGLHIVECVWANPFTFYKSFLSFWHFFGGFLGFSGGWKLTLILKWYWLDRACRDLSIDIGLYIGDCV